MSDTPIDYPEGIDTIDVIRDLRFIKLRKEDRAKVLWLHSEFKSRNLTTKEDAWVRTLARRKIKLIRELHAAQQMARTTDAKQRLGYRKFDEMMEKAKTETRLRRLRRLRRAERELEEAKAASQDFGI